MNDDQLSKISENIWDLHHLCQSLWKVRNFIYIYLSHLMLSTHPCLKRCRCSKTHPLHQQDILQDMKTGYSKAKKMIYILIIATKRLQPYFQAHLVVVLINQPLKSILRRLNTSGCLVTWIIKHKEFYIDYRPWSAMKAGLYCWMYNIGGRASYQQSQRKHKRWLVDVTYGLGFKF